MSAAPRKRDAFVAEIEIHFSGDVTLLQRLQYGLRIGLEQLGVAAYHSADESRPGQSVELLGLEGLDLAGAVFEPLRDVGDGKFALGAQLGESTPGPDRDSGFDRLIQSNRPFCNS